jgi:hypothetical protein
MTPLALARDGRTLTVRIPMAFRRRPGRKLVVVPEGARGDRAGREAQMNNVLVNAIARAHRWRRLLESGSHSTIAELAEAEHVNPSYVSRVLRLTLLTPEIIECVLDGRQSATLTLAKLMEPFPTSWREQTHAGLSGP